MRKAAKEAIVNVLRDKCKIMDFDSLVDKMEADPDSVYEALDPVQEQYSLTDDDVESILYMLEYDF